MVKMKLETDNEFSRGAIAGTVSATIICLFLEAMEKLGLTGFCWFFMAGHAVLEFKHGTLFNVFAFLVHLGVGAFWGVIIAFLYTKVFSGRYLISKGLLIGSSIFFFHIGLMAKALHYPAQLREDPLTVFIIYLSYLIYGALTSVILEKVPWEKTG